MTTTNMISETSTTSAATKAQYPDPKWFADQLFELEAQKDAMIRLAKAHGIDVKTIAPVRSNRLTLKEAAFRTVQEAGHAIHLNDILGKVEEMGAPAGGRRPGNTLHASMSRDARLKLVAPNTWALAEWEEN